MEQGPLGLCSLALDIQSVPLATELSISLIMLRVTTIRRTIDTHYRHNPFHFSHNERTPIQISLQYLHWC